MAGSTTPRITFLLIAKSRHPKVKKRKKERKAREETRTTKQAQRRRMPLPLMKKKGKIAKTKNRVKKKDLMRTNLMRWLIRLRARIISDLKNRTSTYFNPRLS